MDQHSREMYEQVCKPQLEELKKSHDEGILRLENKMDNYTSEVRSWILGNGKEGLMERVRVVEEAQKGDTWRWRMLIGLAGSIAVYLAGHGIYDLIQHLSQLSS